ncbi:MAG: hypothetical protein NWE90_08740 [Candidatus Bathyarchaeota archaeon]|nr:hypothetical protein [Candidatus Bathyarchaeota archaeon]
MKKIALISILLLLLLFGCDQETYDPLGPYPADEEGIIARFIKEGWIAYNDGDFELGFARFDSAVKMDASNPAVYVGLGFANMQLGSEDVSRFDMAMSAFGFVPTLEGGSPIHEVDNGELDFWYITPDSTLFGFGVDPDNTPILGVITSTVSFIPGWNAPGEVEEQDVEVMRITDNTIVTVPTTDTFDMLYIPLYEDSIAYDFTYDTTLFWIDTIIVEIDTLTSDTIILEHIEVDTLVDTLVFVGDRLHIDYAYFDGDMSRTLALAFAGLAQTAQIVGRLESEYNAEEDALIVSDVMLTSIIYAKAVLTIYGDEGTLRADVTEIPVYVDPAITTRNVRLLLAQSYFYYGYLYNCMWEIWRLDPTLIDYFDPESPTFERDLQEKLEELQQ